MWSKNVERISPKSVVAVDREEKVQKVIIHYLILYQKSETKRATFEKTDRRRMKNISH